MQRTKIVFFTGAGISAESGLRTFRDSDGLWNQYNVFEVASIQGWYKNPQIVLDFCNEKRRECYTAQPNQAHLLISELEKDYDVFVITQNIDDLHEKAGSSNVLHLHGEITKACSSKDTQNTVPYVEDIKIGDLHEDGSQLRPHVVLFGESVPNIDKAVEKIESADILVVIGTSLEVFPAAGIISLAKPTCKKYCIDPNNYGLGKEWVKISDIATVGMKQFIDQLK